MKVKKLMSVVWYSYKKKVFSKTFIFMHLFYFAIFALSIGASLIFAFSSEETPSEPTIILIDQTTFDYGVYFSSDSYIKDFNGTLTEAMSEVNDSKARGVVVIDANDEGMPVFTIITYDNSNTALLSQLEIDARNVHGIIYMIKNGIPGDAFVPSIDMQVLKEDADSVEKVAMITGLSVLIIMVLMIVSFPALSIISNDIIYEKSDRTMELIVSSVSSHSIFHSKILVGFLLTLTELIGLSLMVLLGIGVVIRFGSSVDEGFLQLISQGLVYLRSEINVGLTVFTVVGYASLMLTLYMTATVVFVSFATDIETGGYWMLIPVMAMVILSQLSLAVPMNPTSALSRFLAYFPLSSGFVLPVKILFDTASNWEIAISTSILALSIFLSIYYGKKVFAKNAIKYSDRQRKKGRLKVV